MPARTAEEAMKHRKALITIAVASALDVLGGIAFAAAERLPAWRGLYWAVATATTVGYGDVVPHGTAGHILAVLVMVTIVPTPTVLRSRSVP